MHLVQLLRVSDFCDLLCFVDISSVAMGRFLFPSLFLLLCLFTRPVRCLVSLPRPGSGVVLTSPTTLPRTQLVSTILTTLDHPDTKFILIQSPPASGKTSTIQQVIARSTQSVLYVPLASLRPDPPSTALCTSDQFWQRISAEAHVSIKSVTSLAENFACVCLDDAQVIYHLASVWTDLLKQTSALRVLAAASFSSSNTDASTPLGFNMKVRSWAREHASEFDLSCESFIHCGLFLLLFT